MIQDTLPSVETTTARVVELDGIKALFTEVVDGHYDVILEINSQKFLIKLCNDGSSIENFEVIATRGFVYDLTNSLVLTLKNLVQCLRFRLD